MSQRLIRLPQVKDMVGLGTTAIYDKIKKGEFPKQVKLGRLSGWVESEVQAWIGQQIQASRPAVAHSLQHSQAV
jgi:prophage regulatory protein